MVVLTIILVALGSLIGGRSGGMIAFGIAFTMNFVELLVLRQDHPENVRRETGL